MKKQHASFGKIAITPVRNKIAIPELIFVIYFWGFVLLRQLSLMYGPIVLITFSLLLMCFFVFCMLTTNDMKWDRSILNIVFLYSGLFIADAALRNNAYSFNYLYQYMYSGLVPIIFLSKVRNAKKLLYYYSCFSVVAFFLYMRAPFNGYDPFSDYMDFGLNFALPAFLGLFLFYHYFKVKWMIVLEVCCFLLLIFFANRSASLTAIFFMFFYFLLLATPRNAKSIKHRWLLSIGTLSAIVYANLDIVMEYLYNIMIEIGYNVRLISMSYQYLYFDGDAASLLAHRLGDWESAIKMIGQSPVIGHGVGAFQASTFGTYAHNIFLDILLSYGLVGFLTFCIILYYSIRQILKLTGAAKVLGLVFFSLWFPVLLFSITFFQSMGFWCFLAFPYIAKRLR